MGKVGALVGPLVATFKAAALGPEIYPCIIGWGVWIYNSRIMMNSEEDSFKITPLFEEGVNILMVFFIEIKPQKVFFIIILILIPTSIAGDFWTPPPPINFVHDHLFFSKFIIIYFFVIRVRLG